MNTSIKTFRCAPTSHTPFFTSRHCIEQQGPLCVYWCFATERFCGWIKRKAQKNRSSAITSLGNQMTAQKQVSERVVCTAEGPDANAGFQMFRVLASLLDPSVAMKFMQDAPDETKFPPTSDSSSTPSKYKCQMSGKVADTLATDGRHLSILTKYLTAMCYNDRDMRSRRLRVIQWQEVAALRIQAWNSLLCHPDHSDHRYRSGITGRSERSHNQSWVKVSATPDGLGEPVTGISSM